jgi:prepilin-type N-terminal cleavage/methylation domain-containing protein/prepilin-type processing-associated H-X9-DG protein
VINDVSTRFGSAPRRRPISTRAGFTLVELLICIALVLMLVAILLPAARKSIEAGRQITCLDHLRQISQATTLYCMDNDEFFPSAAADDAPPQRADWIYWRKTTASAPFNDVTKSGLARYLGASNAATVFRCPSDACDTRPPNSWGPEPYLYSYSMNGWIGETLTLSLYEYRRWLRLRDVINPSEIILFVDEDQQSIDDGCWLPTGIQNPAIHNELSNRHDVNHDTPGTAGYDETSRGNVAFCDGHAEFVQRQFSVDLIGSKNNPYRDHYQPTKRPLPPDVPY